LRPSKRSSVRVGAGFAYALREFFVHQRQANGVLRGIEQLVKFVERAKHLQSSGDMNERSAGMARFHTAHGVDGGTYAIGQVLLQQMASLAGKRNSLPQPGQATLNR